MDKFEQALKDAAESKHGLALLCHGAMAADKVRRLLYVRRAHAQKRGVRDYDSLSISFSPNSGDMLFIYTKLGGEGDQK